MKPGIIILYLSLVCSLQVKAQTYNVGIGGTYTTLNDAITAYNSMVLTQPVVFLLTDASYNVTASLAITTNPTASSSNTLTIKPAPNVSSIISTAVGGAIFKISGDHIIIDGSNNGSTSRDLTINNEFNNLNVQIGGADMATSAENITLKNCILMGGPAANFNLNLESFAGSAPGYFNNITIQNNSIAKTQFGIYIQAATGPFQNGTNVKILDNNLADTGINAIKRAGVTLSGLSFGCTIQNNTIGNTTVGGTNGWRGILVSTACSTVVIKNNNILNVTYTGTTSSAPKGIEINSPGGNNILVEANTVSGIASSSSGTCSGIEMTSIAGNAINVVIQKNVVSNITNNRAAALAAGILFAPSSSTNTSKLYNNFVFGISGGISAGIYTASSGLKEIAYNTVLMTDPTGESYAFYFTSVTTLICRNNNFINRSASTSSSYGANCTSSAIGTNIDNNNYVGTPLGKKNNTDVFTMADMQTQGFGANSVNINPVFVSATDLHMATTGNETLDNKGTPIAGVITDIDDSARSASTPDIGADEFGSISGGALIINCTAPASRFCPGASFNVSYTVQGGTPNSGNVYTVQLSSLVGDFTSPTVIGTLASTDITGVIAVTVPSTASGSFYHIRVLSSAPAYTGNNNGTDLVLRKPATGNITGADAAVVGVANAFSVAASTGSTYAWAFTNGTQNTGGTSNAVTATFNAIGSQQASVTETDNFGCVGNTVIKMVTVTDESNSNVLLSGSLTGSYPTLKAAFDAVNTGGGSGNVTATIIGNTTETAQAKINQTAYTVLVVPQGNRIIAGNLDTSVIMLNGADNITIDGQSLTGANTLTIRNTSTAVAASAIRLENAASNNTIRKCTIEASATGTSVSSGGLVINNGTLPGDNLNNSIDGNLVKPSSSTGLTFGIVVGSGNTSTTNTFTGTRITNNIIENVFSTAFLQSTGILIRNNTINTLIKGNSIYNTLTFNNLVSDASYFAIRVNAINSSLGGGNIIDSNFIGGTAAGAAGNKMQFSSPNNYLFTEGIYVNENITNAATAVTRNVIRNFAVESANPTANFTAAFVGIEVIKANLQQFENNTIGATENNAINIVMKPAGTGTISVFGIILATACANPIANNFIGGLTITNTPILGSAARSTITLIETSGGAAAANIKNNTIGSALANNISIANSSSVPMSFYGISNYNPAASATTKIDSNIVRNITASNTNVSGIENYIYTAAPTTATTTINGNAVNSISIAGNSILLKAISHNTESSVNTLVQTLVVNNNAINNVTATSGSAVSLFGISILNNSTAANRCKGSMASNTIANMVNGSIGMGGITAGLNYSNDIILNDSMVFSGNSFTNIKDAGTLALPGLAANSNGMLIGMNNSGSNGLAIIRDNVVSDVAATSATNNPIRVNGIAVLGNAIVIERNKIYNLQNAATANTARLEAILLQSRSDDGNTSLLRNNMIALNASTAAQIAGIRLQLAGQKANIYHNSVLTEGTSAANSYALLKDAAPVIDVKNNILFNAITGAGNAYAIGLQTNTTGYTGNNNYFVSPTTAGLAQAGATSYTLAAWQVATNQDAATQLGQSGVTTSASGLFIDKATATLLVNVANALASEKVSNKGLALAASVPSDFLLTLRNTSTPDIGAHEFVLANSGVNWTGNVSTAWENPENWANNQVPTATTVVIIPSGRPRYPEVSVSTSVKSIAVAPGATVTIASGINITILGN
jgi:hypothetical protein